MIIGGARGATFQHVNLISNAIHFQGIVATNNLFVFDVACVSNIVDTFVVPYVVYWIPRRHRALHKWTKSTTYNNHFVNA